jgi:hypothetical protein
MRRFAYWVCLLGGAMTFGQAAAYALLGLASGGVIPYHVPFWESLRLSGYGLATLGAVVFALLEKKGRKPGR